MNPRSWSVSDGTEYEIVFCFILYYPYNNWGFISHKEVSHTQC